MTINQLKFKRVSKLQDDDSLLTLGLMQHLNKEFNNAILKDAVKIKLGNNEISVASPEVLILLKSQSTRLQDQVDVIKLKENCQLDEKYLDTWKNQF